MSAAITIDDFIGDPALLGPFFTGGSWDVWRAVLRAAFALPMSATDLALFGEVSGDRAPPRDPVRELVCAVGRGGGKDAVASALATFLAVTMDPTRLRPGERGVILCLANDRDKSGIVLDYIRGYFEAVPMLAGLVERITGDTIDLTNRARIIVGANNFRAPRGRTLVAAIYDEVSTWRSDDSATPDVETDSAVAPGLARWPGSLKIMISSVYRRAGLFYDRYEQTFGQDDPDCLCVLGESRQFNPTLDAGIIERELAKDPARASAEYLIPSPLEGDSRRGFTS